MKKFIPVLACLFAVSAFAAQNKTYEEPTPPNKEYTPCPEKQCPAPAPTPKPTRCTAKDRCEK